MQTLDKYQVLEKIGVGGFGVVYKAYDPFIKRHVAIKTCTSEETETRERFMREAEIAGNLHHRNIVTVYDFGFQEGVPYLVQEYLTGEDLDRKIKRREYLSLPEKLLFLVQIARGLQYAHSRGVVHRDIKPANIRILEDDTAKIMDFGIAKLAQHQETLTQEGITLGTAAYLAPEQIRGGAFDARTDLFSFGILAYELLAFERPFQGAEISAVFYKILNEAAPSLAEKAPDCPAELERIVQRCLEKEPQKRYSSCTDLLHDIETLAHRRPGAAADPNATAQLTARTARAPQATLLPTTPPAPATAMLPTVALPAPPPARAISLADIELDSRHGLASAGGDGRATHASRPPSRPARSLLKGLAFLALAAAAGWGGWRYWEESRTVLPDRPAAAPATLPEAPAASARAASPGETAPAPDAAPAASDPGPGAESAPASRATDEPASTSASLAAPAVEDAPPPPPAPKPAVLTVAAGWDSAMSLRLGGKVWTLDRERRLELAAGSYRLKFAIESPAYSHAEELTVRLAEGESRRIASPIERPGKLTVQPHINARQAYVRLDGAPAVATPLRGRWLAPGPHIVEIVATADPASPVLQVESIEIRSESESILTFDLDGRSPQRLAEKPILPN
jgi:hypothetical protein